LRFRRNAQLTIEFNANFSSVGATLATVNDFLVSFSIDVMPHY